MLCENALKLFYSPRTSQFALGTARAMAAGSVQPKAGFTIRFNKAIRESLYIMDQPIYFLEDTA